MSTMSTPPDSVSALKQVSASQESTHPRQLFGGCWSCRILSGGGLLVAAGYVFLAARNVMRRGGTTTVGTVAQIAFAASLASWGVVVLTDPVGKAQKKT